MPRILSKFLPQHCLFCQDEHHSGSRLICNDCEQYLPWEKNKKQDTEFVLFKYQYPINYMLTQLKFHRKIIYAHCLAYFFIKAIQSYYNTIPHVLIPIPLHKTRLQSRGFNQSLEIAKPIANTLSIQITLDLMHRIKNTKPQSQLNADARQHNVKNAFHIKKKIDIPEIIIFDDVTTTGNTIDAAKQVLQTHHVVKKITTWCCAKAHLQKP